MNKEEVIKKWQSALFGFENYLKIDKSLSKNSIAAYITDINVLADYMTEEHNLLPDNIDRDSLNDFFVYLSESKQIQLISQVRYRSSINAFYKYLIYVNITDTNPLGLTESPKIGRKIPQVLSFEEIEAMEDSIVVGDTTKGLSVGARDVCILEFLYSCGLRVSELVNLQMENLHLEEDYIIVKGKGNKERLIPINIYAKTKFQRYIQDYRSFLRIPPQEESYVFLNQRGKHLSRMWIFNIVKKAAADAGVQKEISPHTLRHSFATHLLYGGADLPSIQAMLGHSSITTTEIYTHIDTSFLMETLQSFHPRYKNSD